MIEIMENGFENDNLNLSNGKGGDKYESYGFILILYYQGDWYLQSWLCYREIIFYTQFFVELSFYNYEPPPFSTLWTYSKGLTLFWSIPVGTALFPCVGRSLQISGQGWKFSAIVSSIYFASFQVEEVSA